MPRCLVNPLSPASPRRVDGTLSDGEGQNLKTNNININPVEKIVRRTSRVAGKITAELASSFAGGLDVSDDDDAMLSSGASIAPRRSSLEAAGPAGVLGSAGAEWGNGSINSSGIGGFPVGGAGKANRRQSGKLQRRQSRSTSDALSNLATSLGIGAFDLDRELGLDARGGAKKPDPPSMAASGKLNPFRQQPFRTEDVRGKTHVLVHNEDLWRDFKSELDISGVKTGLGVKMVLLKFVSKRIPGDEAATKAMLEDLWRRQKMEDHVASGKMRGAISAPSLVDATGSGGVGGGGGFLGTRRRASNASAAFAPQKNATFNLFRSSQSAAVPVNHGIGVSDSISIGGTGSAANGYIGGGNGNVNGLRRNNVSSGSLGLLADIPSKIVTRKQQRGDNGAGSSVDPYDNDDASAITGVSAQESLGAGPTASKGDGSAETFTPAMENDMAKAAAIVAAMGLDDLSCDGEEGNGVGGDNDDDDDDDGDSCTELSDLHSAGSYSRRSGTSSRPRPSSSFDLSAPSAGDWDETERVMIPCAFGRLNDMDGEDSGGDGRQEAEKDSSSGAGLLRRRRSGARRQSFGNLSSCSLGTMSVADITIEEDLFEDLESGSSDEEESNDRGPGSIRKQRQGCSNDGNDEAGGINVHEGEQIECISVAAGSQFGELSEYGEKTEVGAGSESGGNGSEYGWGMQSECGDETADTGGDGDSSGICQYECGRGYLSGDSEGLASGYIDCKGNVNTDEVENGQGCCNEEEYSRQKVDSGLSPPPHLKGLGKKCDKQDIDETYLSQTQGQETHETEEESRQNEDFILSFPSPEKRAEMRDFSLSNGQLDDKDDDDSEADLPFPTWEEREMIRMGNNSCPCKGDNDGKENGLEINDASSNTWTSESLHDSLRAEVLDQPRRQPGNNRSRWGGREARSGAPLCNDHSDGEGNWVERMFQRKRQNRRAEVVAAANGQERR